MKPKRSFCRWNARFTIGGSSVALANRPHPSLPPPLDRRSHRYPEVRHRQHYFLGGEIDVISEPSPRVHQSRLSETERVTERELRSVLEVRHLEKM